MKRRIAVRRAVTEFVRRPGNARLPHSRGRGSEGISVYLTVFLDGDLFVKMIHDHRLVWASRTYRLAETHVDTLTLADPFAATIIFSELGG